MSIATVFASEFPSCHFGKKKREKSKHFNFGLLRSSFLSSTSQMHGKLLHFLIVIHRSTHIPKEVLLMCFLFWIFVRPFLVNMYNERPIPINARERKKQNMSQKYDVEWIEIRVCIYPTKKRCVQKSQPFCWLLALVLDIHNLWICNFFRKKFQMPMI